MSLSLTRTPESLYCRISYSLQVAQMYYRIREGGEVVGLIDLENRTFNYEGSHSRVERILEAIANEQFASVVAEKTEGPFINHFDVPKTGESLARTLDDRFDTITEPDAGFPLEDSDPDHVASERVRRDSISEDHPLRPPAEPSDFLVARQKKAEEVQTEDADEEDIPSQWDGTASEDEMTLDELEAEGIDESIIENLRDND